MSADYSHHLREAYGVVSLSSRHPALRRLKTEQTSPSIHGNKLWGACYLLMDYLSERPLDRGCKVLDLGCGWGLGGIFCAKSFGAEVTGLDADPAVFPFVDLLAQHNGVDITPLIKPFDRLSSDELAEYDVIIGADICFWDELADEVQKVIDLAINAGVGQIIITDPQRPPFNELAEYCVDAHYAEIYQVEVDSPRRFTGSALVIENH